MGSDGRCPYPATENWQKTIGGHSIWSELDVPVEVEEARAGRVPRVRQKGKPRVAVPRGKPSVVPGPTDPMLLARFPMRRSRPSP